jgi:hypothetical protein
VVVGDMGAGLMPWFCNFGSVSGFDFEASCKQLPGLSSRVGCPEFTLVAVLVKLPQSTGITFGLGFRVVGTTRRINHFASAID